MHALEAVLRAVKDEAPDEVWCLGDLVGYGPRPNDCCRLVAESVDVCLVGNHDLAALGRLDLGDFSADAATSARWTASVLDPDALAYLQSLTPSALRAGVGAYHASPRDPVWEYVLSEGAAVAALATASEPIVLVGHSHVALAFALDGGTLDGGLASAGTNVPLGAAERWLLNPGSVGQPRDGDPRAAYLVLDLEVKAARFERIPYAIERTQSEIRERGLPEALAERLAHGL